MDWIIFLSTYGGTSTTNADLNMHAHQILYISKHKHNEAAKCYCDKQITEPKTEILSAVDTIVNDGIQKRNIILDREIRTKSLDLPPYGFSTKSINMSNHKMIGLTDAETESEAVSLGTLNRKILSEIQINNQWEALKYLRRDGQCLTLWKNWTVWIRKLWMTQKIRWLKIWQKQKQELRRPIDSCHKWKWKFKNTIFLISFTFWDIKNNVRWVAARLGYEPPCDWILQLLLNLANPQLNLTWTTSFCKWSIE